MRPLVAEASHSGNSTGWEAWRRGRCWGVQLSLRGPKAIFLSSAASRLELSVSVWRDFQGSENTFPMHVQLVSGTIGSTL